jgi:hypothetical protein
MSIVTFNRTFLEEMTNAGYFGPINTAERVVDKWLEYMPYDPNESPIVDANEFEDAAQDALNIVMAPKAFDGKPSVFSGYSFKMEPVKFVTR